MESQTMWERHLVTDSEVLEMCKFEREVNLSILGGYASTAIYRKTIPLFGFCDVFESHFGTQGR